MNAHIEANPEFTGPEIPRRGNRYLLPDADGRLVEWPGATTFAEELDNPYPLMDWKMQQVARGMALRPDLVAMMAAAPENDRATAREVVHAALDAAATDVGANYLSTGHGLVRAPGP